MRLNIGASVSSVRKPNGFRTFYASFTFGYRRLWVQRWDMIGRPNWTHGLHNANRELA